MTKTRIAVAAAAGLLLALPATAASAAYEDDVVTPEDVPTTVEPGGTLTGTVSFATECLEWDATLTQDSNDTLLGADAASGGTEFTFSIPVPEVPDGTEATLRVDCTYDDGLGPVSSAPASTSPEAVTQAAFVLPTALQTATAFETSITITADAGAGDDDADGSGSGSGSGTGDDTGALPDTGGSNASLLAIGGALVVAGAGVTIAARRRMGAKA